MKAQTKYLMSILIISMLTIGTVNAESDSIGTPGGVTLTSPTTIDLCAKTIQPAGIAWGYCDGNTPHGTFSYEPSGPTLEFDAQAVGLGSNGHDYPEVSGLSVVGVTTSTITWRWTTPDRDYFTKNIVTVRKVSDSSIITGYPKEISLSPNVVINHMVSGLETGAAYKITVQSVYSDDAPVDREYSLIYYKDTDTTHTAPNGQVVELARATSISGVVTFNGYYNIGTDIPADDDANYEISRGKIWIVPTSKILPSLTIDWTGFAVGSRMDDFLYEEDSNLGTPPDNMGGITYTYTP